MTKKPDPAVSMVGSIQGSVTLLDQAVRERGGSLFESLVLLAKPVHAKQVASLADILVGITSRTSTVAEPAREPPSGKVPIKFLTKKELRARCIYSPAHIARLEKAGLFPKRVPIGPAWSRVGSGSGRVGWIESEVEEWLEAQVAKRS